MHMPDRTTIETDTIDYANQEIELKGSLNYALDDDTDEIFIESERDLMIASQTPSKIAARSKSRGI